MLVRPLVCLSVGPHIISKTGYIAIALRRGEVRGNQLMSKTGYVEIASRLVMVARSCYLILFIWYMYKVQVFFIPTVDAKALMVIGSIFPI
jgi:hypothetical protein